MPLSVGPGQWNYFCPNSRVVSAVAGARMNWRLGLFRLWIVGSALFVLAVASVTYSDIKAEFAALDGWNSRPADFELFLPRLCGKARGVAGTDYTTAYGRLPDPSDKSAKPN